MKRTTKDIRHYFREILGAISVKEIMSNENLIQKATHVERLIMNMV